MEPIFRTASHCDTGSCVEVAFTDDEVLVRDAAGGVVTFTVAEWRVFLAGVRDGEFDP